MSSVYPVTQLANYSQNLGIHHFVEAQAERRPDAIAIVAPGRLPLTYGRLRGHMNDVVKTLNAMGIGRNDRVALVLPNGPEMATAFIAVAAGATSAPLNPAYRASEFDFYLSDLQAKAIMIQSGIPSPAIAVAQKRGIPLLSLSPVLEAEAGIFTLTGDERALLEGTGSHEPLEGFAQPGDVALVLHTSGTTSRPKIVPLTQTNICTAAKNIQATLALTERDRCLNVMPLFHIHGLLGAMLSSLAAGASVIGSPGFDASKFFDWMEEFHPTWYTAVPTMHHAVLARAELKRKIIARYPLRFLRSSSAPLPPKVMRELERVFHAPMLESYGMTEASHQMASNPLPPRERKAGSVGIAAGPEVAIMDEVGNLLPPGESGEIVIRGANVMQGYENNPIANKSAFTNGWFRTGDQGFLDTDGYLFITGRLKELINRGGEKISPREVDEVLMEHPALAQAVTFAVPHPTLGEDIAAAVVLRESAAVTEREIREFAAVRLADVKVPRQVVIVEELPKGATGKLQRIGLAEKLGLVSNQERLGLDRAFVAPRDTVELQLTKLWEKVLGIRPIGVTASFFELGGNSLLAVDLFLEIEKLFGKNLPLSTLFQASTIEQLASILRQESWLAPWSSLVAIQSGGSRPPFFCVHAIGANVLNYRNLAFHLGPDQPCYGLQSQGLDGKQLPHTRVEDMAAHYIKEICALQPMGPYFLGGGSSGGVVAFEMAQQLHAQGQKVALLALMDTYLPSPKYMPNPELFHSLVYRFAQRVDLYLGNLVLIGPKGQLIYMLERSKVKIGEAIKRVAAKLYPDIERPLTRTLHKVLEANLQATRDYVPQVYPGRITLFLSREEPVRSVHDSRLGWSELAADGLELHLVPGSHSLSLNEPYVIALAEQLRACLQKAQAIELRS